MLSAGQLNTAASPLVRLQMASSTPLGTCLQESIRPAYQTRLPLPKAWGGGGVGRVQLNMCLRLAKPKLGQAADGRLHAPGQLRSDLYQCCRLDS